MANHLINVINYAKLDVITYQNTNIIMQRCYSILKFQVQSYPLDILSILIYNAISKQYSGI